MTLEKPKLTLVGAGPGDAELITLKGIKAIQSADYILYDALVNPALLEHASPLATQIYVGKRASNHTYSQSEINEMIVVFAGDDKHVVRLKGGDPYIFGRGFEEKSYVEQHGLEVEVVPGISSATAVPALAGVPLTERGVSQSFWVLTATTKSGELSRDIHLASHSSATVVVLMGMKKLAEIVAIFQQAEKGDTPILIIQNGTLPQEKKAFGTIDSILQETERTQVGAPAIIVIGEVAKHGAEAGLLKRELEGINYNEIVHA